MRKSGLWFGIIAMLVGTAFAQPAQAAHEREAAHEHQAAFEHQSAHEHSDKKRPKFVVTQVMGADTWQVTAVLKYRCSPLPSGDFLNVIVTQPGVFAQFMDVNTAITCDGRLHNLTLGNPVMGGQLTKGKATARTIQTRCTSMTSCSSVHTWTNLVSVR